MMQDSVSLWPGAAASKTAAPIPRVMAESVPAAADTDTSTLQTVQMMCRYIAQGVEDPQVQAAARYAFDHFAAGSDRPDMLAWATFWYMKHCVRFRQDEATMFRIGAANEFDLLIAPAVLVRMKDPAEDCDGFTMLSAAIATILGLPVFIATVAVSPSDPSRWSHVFPCALVNGRVVPLDSSHGSGPGWMVPLDRIYRFQAWDLSANPVDIAPMKFQGLHGYMRTGMGDCDYEGDPTCYGGAPISTGGGNPCGSGFLVDGVCQSSPGGLMTTSPVGSTGTTDWGTILGSLFGNAASVARAAETPVTTYRLPNGTIVTGPPPTQSMLSAGSLSSMMPILGIGLAAVLVISMMGKK
jgi:hypothetical protein